MRGAGHPVRRPQTEPSRHGLVMSAGTALTTLPRGREGECRISMLGLFNMAAQRTKTVAVRLSCRAHQAGLGNWNCVAGGERMPIIGLEPSVARGQ
jgi:hypothetical protein